MKKQVYSYNADRVLKTTLWLISPVLASENKSIKKVFTILEQNSIGLVAKNNISNRVYDISILTDRLIIRDGLKYKSMRLDIIGGKTAI